MYEKGNCCVFLTTRYGDQKNNVNEWTYNENDEVDSSQTIFFLSKWYKRDY